MPDEAYDIDLKDGYIISISLTTVQGKVVRFVVRLTDARGETKHDLARYDTAHGWPHLDILTPTGKVREKHWMPFAELGIALSRGIEDFKKNHENYSHDH